MTQRTILRLGIAFIVVGVLGALLLWAFGGASVWSGGFSSNGQRIYYTGADAAGPIPRTGGLGNMAAFQACVGCHGEAGTGGSIGMMVDIVVPDIRYSVLTSKHSEDTSVTSPWTDADIARAIRQGVEPNGDSLDSVMPRWDMSDADVRDVIAYLKELG